MAKFIFLFIFFLLGSDLKAQLLTQDGSCYIYDGEKYCDSKAIKTLFSYNSRAMHWYTKSKLSRKKADILGYSAIIGLGSSYLLLRSSSNARDPRVGLLVSGLGVGLISCILGTIGISASYECANESKKAVDVFNGASFNHIHKMEPNQLSFGLFENGLGLAMRF